MARERAERARAARAFILVVEVGGRVWTVLWKVICGLVGVWFDRLDR